MTRKKASQLQEKPHQTVVEDTAEKLASLKSLNALLLKETVERRQQVDALVQSKESLESEMSRTLLDKQRLESEKLFIEDKTIAADLEQKLTLAFVSSQLGQQAESLKKEIRRANQETTTQANIFQAKLEEKIIDKEKALRETESKMAEQQKKMNEMKDDFHRYRNETEKDLDLKQLEVNRLRSTVVELQKSNADARNEIVRVQMERDEVEQKMEKRYGNLKREMEAAVREKNEIEAAKYEQLRQVESLKKFVEVLTADISCEKEASDRVLREKNLIQQDLDNHIEEVKSLRSTLLQLEKSRSCLHDENYQLQTKHKLLSEDREKMEISLAALERDKASADRNLMLSSQQIEELKKQVTELVAGEKLIQYERSQQAKTIIALQNEATQLSSTIYSLQKQEEGLQMKISELGRSKANAEEKEEQLLMDFNAVVKEKEERERIFEMLIAEKSLDIQSLEEYVQRLEDEGRKMQEIVTEKAEIEQVKFKLEAKISDQHEEIGKLSATVSTLQDSSREHEENVVQLQAEATQTRDALDRIALERDEALKVIDAEKKVLSNSRLKLLELEKIVKELKKENAQLCTERDGLLKKSKEEERSLQLLTEAKDSVQKNLLEVQQCLQDMEVKMISTNNLSDRTLSLLKDTVAVVRGSEQEEHGKAESAIDAEKIEEEIQPIAAELEAIKRAFKNKEAKLEDSSKQVQSLEKSVVEAKKRSFWAWLSSATTIFAAAFVAYVSRDTK